MHQSVQGRASQAVVARQDSLLVAKNRDGCLMTLLSFDGISIMISDQARTAHSGWLIPVAYCAHPFLTLNSALLNSSQARPHFHVGPRLMRESSCASCSAASGGYERGAGLSSTCQTRRLILEVAMLNLTVRQKQRNKLEQMASLENRFSPILSRLWPMKAGSDWPSSRSLLYAKPLRRR